MGNQEVPKVFLVKAGSGTPWRPDQDRRSAEGSVCKRDPKTEELRDQSTEIVFWASSANVAPEILERMDTQPLAHRERQPLRG